MKEYCVQRISNSLESFSLLTTCGGRQDDSEDDDWRRHTSFRKKKDSRISAFFHKWRQNRIQSEATPPTTPTTTLVFGTDLCEHLFDQKTQIPEVLRFCIEFIEKNGIINGIYRLSGISSEIQKLRQIFDRKEIPEFDHKDVHCVSSLLKLYFRSLPNPLLTFHLYDAFVVAIRETTPSSSRRLSQIRRLVARLPPPHARTLAALVRHLNLVSKEWPKTGMNAKNLAIVWAPNLLRSRDLENRLGADLAALQVIGIQAVLTEYLIDNYDHVFALKEPNARNVTSGHHVFANSLSGSRDASHCRERRTEAQTQNRETEEREKTTIETNVRIEAFADASQNSCQQMEANRAKSRHETTGDDTCAHTASAQCGRDATDDDDTEDHCFENKVRKQEKDF
ncbi:unnamed protein product [Medioppia subpectinata]|uniref:Rho-GAP domain-containing protein n=1 Tax=Medioppia subpectinata TaxID=1979941 RepID=A0A7R9KU63_9ACAR|nr:unnamed protein product [Medioppia subpectinata]CAG2108521.1 unnamed protein product [Medioppia subpectinata]